MNIAARVAAILAAVVASLLPAHVLAADAPPDSPVAALERALAAEPDDPTLAYFLALFRARAGDRDGAIEALERVLERGDGFLPTASMFAPIADDRRFGVLRARFERRLPSRLDGRVAFRLRDRALIPEGIAYDPTDRRFYVGSIARKAVYRIGAAGSLVRFSPASADLDPILGLAIDARRRTLYAVSTSALTEAGRASRRNRVVAFDLRDGRVRGAFTVPDAAQLNDVAIAADGRLYVTDSAAGAVWRIDPADGAVEALVPPGRLNAANGIAFSPSGELYVAAARRVVRVDAATGELVPLAMPPRQTSAAIDGLYWHDGALIGVQNVTTPARIVRLVPGADGRSIARVETLQSHHHPAFDEPTTAAIAPDGLYVLARTYVTRYGDKGEIAGASTLAAPLVLRVPLARRPGE